MIHLFMRKILDSVVAGCCLAAAFCLVSCDSDLDIQQEYPFTVEAMPVADEIAAGNTVEIRLEIVPEGDFSGTVYTLRYFQPEGKGRLKMEDGTVLKPMTVICWGKRGFACTTLRKVRTGRRPSTCILRTTGEACNSSPLISMRRMAGKTVERRMRYEYLVIYAYSRPAILYKAVGPCGFRSPCGRSHPY